jgi:hypothetical protein
VDLSEDEVATRELPRRDPYTAKRDWHARQAQLPLKDKVRILLELQRQDLPLLRRLRPLRSWERPWEIDP